ncbi:hypothetical protein ACWEPN_29770 [Nonomuraea wenchangensis]
MDDDDAFISSPSSDDALLVASASAILELLRQRWPTSCTSPPA